MTTHGSRRTARIILVRHGRTNANASGLLLGRLDPPLDDVGTSQAHRLHSVVASGAFGEVQAVVSSPLLRAQQTAEVIAEDSNLSVESDERFIEVDYGDFDGMPITDIAAETWLQWREDLGFSPPGGESLAQVGQRVRDACLEVAERARAGGPVVVVSHVSPIKAAIAWALGVDDSYTWRTHLDTGSISVIDVDRDQPVLRGFNIVPQA